MIHLVQFLVLLYTVAFLHQPSSGYTVHNLSDNGIDLSRRAGGPSANHGPASSGQVDASEASDDNDVTKDDDNTQDDGSKGSEYNSGTSTTVRSTASTTGQVPTTTHQNDRIDPDNTDQDWSNNDQGGSNNNNEPGESTQNSYNDGNNYNEGGDAEGNEPIQNNGRTTTESALKEGQYQDGDNGDGQTWSGTSGQQQNQTNTGGAEATNPGSDQGPVSGSGAVTETTKPNSTQSSNGFLANGRTSPPPTNVKTSHVTTETTSLRTSAVTTETTPSMTSPVTSPMTTEQTTNVYTGTDLVDWESLIADVPQACIGIGAYIELQALTVYHTCVTMGEAFNWLKTVYEASEECGQSIIATLGAHFGSSATVPPHCVCRSTTISGQDFDVPDAKEKCLESSEYAALYAKFYQTNYSSSSFSTTHHSLWYELDRIRLHDDHCQKELVHDIIHTFEHLDNPATCHIDRCFNLEALQHLFHAIPRGHCTSANSLWGYINDVVHTSDYCFSRFLEHFADFFNKLHMTGYVNDDCECTSTVALQNMDTPKIPYGRISTCEAAQGGSYTVLEQSIFENAEEVGCMTQSYLWNQLNLIEDNDGIDCAKDFIIRAVQVYPVPDSDHCVCTKKQTTTTSTTTSTTPSTTTSTTTTPSTTTSTTTTPSKTTSTTTTPSTTTSTTTTPSTTTSTTTTPSTTTPSTTTSSTTTPSTTTSSTTTPSTTTSTTTTPFTTTSTTHSTTTSSQTTKTTRNPRMTTEYLTPSRPMTQVVSTPTPKPRTTATSTTFSTSSTNPTSNVSSSQGTTATSTSTMMPTTSQPTATPSPQSSPSPTMSYSATSAISSSSQSTASTDSTSESTSTTPSLITATTSVNLTITSSPASTVYPTSSATPMASSSSETSISSTSSIAPTTSTSSTQTTSSSRPRTFSCLKYVVIGDILESIRVDHLDANPCDPLGGGSNEAYVLSTCNVTLPVTWSRGVQVMDECNSITHYTPIAAFDGDAYNHRGTLSGVFIECTSTGFKVAVQHCGSSPEIMYLETGGLFLHDPFNYYVIT